MNLGLLLLKKSGKQGSLKFIITMAAAALGTLILLFVFSVTNAVTTSNNRGVWKSALYDVDSSSTQQLSKADLEKPGAVLFVPSNDGNLQTFFGENINN